MFRWISVGIGGYGVGLFFFCGIRVLVFVFFRFGLSFRTIFFYEFENFEVEGGSYIGGDIMGGFLAGCGWEVGGFVCDCEGFVFRRVEGRRIEK